MCKELFIPRQSNEIHAFYFSIIGDFLSLSKDLKAHITSIMKRNTIFPQKKSPIKRKMEKRKWDFEGLEHEKPFLLIKFAVTLLTLLIKQAYTCHAHSSFTSESGWFVV